MKKNLFLKIESFKYQSIFNSYESYILQRKKSYIMEEEHEDFKTWNQYLSESWYLWIVSSNYNNLLTYHFSNKLTSYIDSLQMQKLWMTLHSCEWLFIGTIKNPHLKIHIVVKRASYQKYNPLNLKQLFTHMKKVTLFLSNHLF